MPAEPHPDLAAAILSRSADLATYMLQTGIDATVASGVTANGHPCTTIIAIGWTAETARAVGEALVREVARQKAEASEQAGRN